MFTVLMSSTTSIARYSDQLSCSCVIAATASGALIAGIILGVLFLFTIIVVLVNLFVKKKACFAKKETTKKIVETTDGPTTFSTDATYKGNDEQTVAYDNIMMEGDDGGVAGESSTDPDGFQTVDLSPAFDRSKTFDTDIKPSDNDTSVTLDETPSRTRQSYAAAMTRPQTLPPPPPSHDIIPEDIGESV